MRRLTDRYTMDLDVELTSECLHLRVMLQDLSRTGMFLHTAAPVAVGTIVRVGIVHEGRRLTTLARVTHALPEVDAHALGRYPGIGVAFAAPTSLADQLFAIAIERLVRSCRDSAPPARVHILVADPDTRLLERMSSALGEAGFSVATASNGMEALAACLRFTPDVILIDRAMPVYDGFRVLWTLRNDPQFAHIPVIVTSGDLNDLSPAFDHGAIDFIAKPFTALEVIVRARRVAAVAPDLAAVVLRGTLGELGLPALLTMLELERKTARLTVTGEDVAWIDVVDGRIAGAGSSAGGDPRATLMVVLGWRHGTFELSSTTAHADDLGLPITHVLMEHARVTDEAAHEAAAPDSPPIRLHPPIYAVA